MPAPRRLLVTVLSAMALLAACGGSTDPVDVGSGGDAGGDGPGPVGAWVLAEADPALEVPAGASITLTVEDVAEGTRVSGTAACNTYEGEVSWDAVTGAWSVGELAVTEMGCEETLMAAEAAYLEALTGADRHEVDGDRLVLTGGAATLTFRATDG